MPNQIILPRIIGHRGAKGFAPENTLISFKKAHELGAKWVELDVKETKDQVLIVTHDDSLQRTTQYNEIVANTTWETIQKLDAGSWFSKEFKGEKIPSLDQCIKLFETLNLCVNIEIKPCQNKDESTAKLVANFIKDKWPSSLPPPLVTSFSMESLKVAKRANPNIIIGLLFHDNLDKNWKEIANDLDAKTININKEMANKKIIDEIKNEGYKVLVYTVNLKIQAEELFKLGVDSVFTDYPMLQIQT